MRPASDQTLQLQLKEFTLGLFSYVVARDYGFAPNPFFNICTLATCKPGIRRAAQPGEWVIGTGSATRKRAGYLVYAMKIDEVMTFGEYWNDSRFAQKRPNLRGSKKQAFGDNIYHFAKGVWQQLNSHHSFSDGSPNRANIANDTQANRVLIGADFVYFGGAGPRIPTALRNHNGANVCAGRGFKKNFSDAHVNDVIAWVRSLGTKGYAGDPIDWDRTP
jgi:hypothetical protein